MIETWETIKKSDRQIIDIGYSNHMISDKKIFEHTKNYNGGSVRFGMMIHVA